MCPTEGSIEKLKLISKQKKKEGWSNTVLSVYTKTVHDHVANFQQTSSGGFEKQLNLPKVKQKG